MALTSIDPGTRNALLIWRALARWQAREGPRPNPTLPVLPPHLHRDTGWDRITTLPALPDTIDPARLAHGRMQ